MACHVQWLGLLTYGLTLCTTVSSSCYLQPGVSAQRHVCHKDMPSCIPVAIKCTNSPYVPCQFGMGLFLSQCVLMCEGAGHDVPGYLHRLAACTSSCCCQALHCQQALRMQLEQGLVRRQANIVAALQQHHDDHTAISFKVGTSPARKVKARTKTAPLPAAWTVLAVSSTRLRQAACVSDPSAALLYKFELDCFFCRSVLCTHLW